MEETVTSCGPACTVCRIPDHAVASCAHRQCDFTCDVGYARCADGCCPKIISVGSELTCYSNGTLSCWGNNDYGQLGDGSNTGRSFPDKVRVLYDPIVSMSAGYLHACAVTSRGQAYCWGDDYFGQLGWVGDVRSNRYNPLPTPVPGLSSGVRAIAAASSHTCALSDDGVRCWGSSVWFDHANPELLAGIAPGELRTMTAGQAHFCGLTNQGDVRCWGVNYDGVLGDCSSDGSVPNHVEGLGPGVKAVVAGGRHSCAIRADGSLRCWGSNDSFALGQDNLEPSCVPIEVPGVQGSVIGVASGEYHTCAISDQGTVQCWGAGPLVGYATDEPYVLPGRTVELPGKAVSIAAGEYHTCVRLENDAVMCWGLNWSGQLGDYDYDGPTPIRVLGI